jgi:IS30 family transposase
VGFFAHPFAAWKRGTNKNMNGLCRQYIPKNQNFVSVNETEVELIMHRLNNRPRKCLDYLSPFDAFFDKSITLTS